MILIPGMLVVGATQELKTGHGCDPAMRRQWHPEEGQRQETYSA